ncbi:cysteine hydrolase family protein [Amphibacillus sediminis]|uniref:cysteine hydrolase family protein n=1 Tax=Amphibacillus sediminis TaxID=360185 RepID=UPI000B1602AC|nr:cysteine hydrolase family protein [Amphibacillus sediminis]
MQHILLIIDAQQELIEGNQQEGPVYRKEQLLFTINSVIQKAELLKVPVVFVRDLDVAQGHGHGFQIHPSIHIPGNAEFFDKAATNSFYGTGLLEYLQVKQIDHLVIMGCITEHCIDSAVRTATISGFDVTLVREGHSTTDNETLSADQIIRHHNQTLHGHYNVDHFALVRAAVEDLFNPTHDTYR